MDARRPERAAPRSSRARCVEEPGRRWSLAGEGQGACRRRAATHSIGYGSRRPFSKELRRPETTPSTTATVSSVDATVTKNAGFEEYVARSFRIVMEIPWDGSRGTRFSSNRGMSLGPMGHPSGEAGDAPARARSERASPPGRARAVAPQIDDSPRLSMQIPVDRSPALDLLARIPCGIFRDAASPGRRRCLCLKRTPRATAANASGPPAPDSSVLSVPVRLPVSPTRPSIAIHGGRNSR